MNGVLLFSSIAHALLHYTVCQVNLHSFPRDTATSQKEGRNQSWAWLPKIPLTLFLIVCLHFQHVNASSPWFPVLGAGHLSGDPWEAYRCLWWCYSPTRPSSLMWTLDDPPLPGSFINPLNKHLLVIYQIQRILKQKILFLPQALTLLFLWYRALIQNSALSLSLLLNSSQMIRISEI